MSDQVNNINLDELRKISQSINSSVKQPQPTYTPPSILKKNIDIDNMTGVTNPHVPKKVEFNSVETKVETSESIIPEQPEVSPLPTVHIDGYTIANILLPKQTVYLAVVIVIIAFILYYFKK